jgi:hypothetical protein
VRRNGNEFINRGGSLGERTLNARANSLAQELHATTGIVRSLTITVKK